MRRYSIGQLQKGSQPHLLAFTEVLDIRPALRSANDRTDGYRDNNNQFVFLRGSVTLLKGSSIASSGFLGMAISVGEPVLPHFYLILDAITLGLSQVKSWNSGTIDIDHFVEGR